MTMLSELTFYIGVGISLALFSLSALGVFAFYPRRHVRENSAAGWLILAMWSGFLATTLNMLYWNLVGTVGYKLGFENWESVSRIGMVYGDIIWKSIACVSVYLHFYARYKSIPEGEQRHWSPLLMGFYPDTNHWALKYLRATRPLCYIFVRRKK